MRRREFIGLGLGGAAAVSLGAAFWDDLFGSTPSRAPLRARRRGYGPLRRAGRATACGCPRAFASRVVARGDERWRAPATAGTAPPTAWPPFPPRRRLRARVELRGARGRRVGAALRRRRRGPRRLPDPRRHDPELLRRRARPGAPGCRARRSRTGACGSATRRAASAPSRHAAMGDLQARGGGGRPARAARLPHRGPDRRRALPLHARALARPVRRACSRSRGWRAAGPWSGSRCPTRWRARERTRRQVPGSTALQARRGDLARRRARSTWSPPPTTACTPTTPRSERIRVIYDGLASRERAAAARGPDDRLAGGRGVRVRGHRHRGDRHRRDRAATGSVVALPVGHRAAARAARS